jgi:hypothetical protein
MYNGVHDCDGVHLVAMLLVEVIEPGKSPTQSQSDAQGA